jgi:hypothetical protein
MHLNFNKLHYIWVGPACLNTYGCAIYGYTQVYYRELDLL